MILVARHFFHARSPYVASIGWALRPPQLLSLRRIDARRFGNGRLLRWRQFPTVTGRVAVFTGGEISLICGIRRDLLRANIGVGEQG